MVENIEKTVELDELSVDSPHLHRIKCEGYEKGFEEGRKEGEILTLRRNTLDVVVWRFDPPTSLYLKMRKILSGLNSVERLDALFEKIVRAEMIDEFKTTLDEMAAEEAVENENSS